MIAEMNTEIAERRGFRGRKETCYTLFQCLWGQSKRALSNASERRGGPGIFARSRLPSHRSSLRNETEYLSSPLLCLACVSERRGENYFPCRVVARRSARSFALCFASITSLCLVGRPGLYERWLEWGRAKSGLILVFMPKAWGSEVIVPSSITPLWKIRATCLN